MKNNSRVSPFEQNYSLRRAFYIRSLGFGLYWRIRPTDWLRIFWRHPEADVTWYDVGPFAFFRG